MRARARAFQRAGARVLIRATRPGTLLTGVQMAPTMSAPPPPPPPAPAPTAPATPESPKQFPCRNCGANLDYAPGTTSLKCQYCGTENEIAVEAKPILEHSIKEIA